VNARARAALAAVLWLAAALPADAYQRDEHYYSQRIALASLRPPLPGADVVAFCGQLADEAPELNAIAVYERLMRHPLDYASWTLRGSGPDATVGTMVTVQQLLHSLTGGSASAARSIATTTVKASFAAAERAESASPQERADALCALGFALHLYGDTFAHRRLKNQRRMYRTGIGHLFDASTPDFPLSGPERLDLWREYVTSLRVLFPASRAAGIDPLLAGAAESRAAARSANAFNRDALIRFETAELARHGVEPAPIPLNSAKKSCQQLADAYAAARGWKAAPSCERSWALHRAAAERAYADYDADPAHEGEPSRVDAVRPFYDGPLFEGGRP
jgi:hypothetical protein